jgi:DNA sulfur modification protein DndD
VLANAVAADEVILHVSDKERTQLEQWIEQALEEAPLAFSRVIQQIAALQQAAAALDADLARVPADELLAPLVARLHDLLRTLGALEQTQAQHQEELRALAYAQEQTGFALRRARTAIEEQEAAGQRVDLTARTQRVLDDYKAALTRRKVTVLEHALVSHFNQLCRKHAFVDRISVDLATCGMTLHRAGHSFTRARLSAGENQLLAIATLWALRELSGRATPIIIDTPLSRLDSQHRQSMLHDFFPHASHQVILLATDAEIDAAALKLLAPVIARVYRMEYDPATGATTHTVETPAVVTPNLTLFEEVR